MTDSSKNSKSTDETLIVHIPLPKEILQRVQAHAVKNGESIEEFIANLVTDIIHRYQIQEKIHKDFDEWKAPLLIQVISLNDHSLKVKFDDGLEGVYEMKSHILKGGVFYALDEMDFFNKVTIKGNGSYIAWSNKIEIDADSIYATVMRDARKWRP